MRSSRSIFAVAFDLHAPTFRHKMYDQYKGNEKADAAGIARTGPGDPGSARSNGH